MKVPEEKYEHTQPTGVLRTLEHEAEIRACFETFYRTLTGEDFTESPSEKHPAKHPAPREGIEFRIGPDKSSSGLPHYTCILSHGSQDLLQINHSRAAADKGVAGRYLRDDEGNFYIGHVGNIKFKNRPEGFSQSDLLAASLAGSVERVSWNGESEEEVLVLGRVGSPYLWVGILDFLGVVLEAKGFEGGASGGPGGVPSTPNGYTFTPEPDQRKKYVRPKSEFEARCIHSQVIAALKRHIEHLGLEAYNDRERDLFTVAENGDMVVLFEAKSKVSTQDIYTAIGQLMIHGEGQENPPKRVLVVPALLDGETTSRLERLDIDVLAYSLDETRISFRGDDLIRALMNSPTSEMEGRET